MTNAELRTLAKDSLSRVLSALCWVFAAILATIAANELLHRSKSPELLFWSYKKLLVCLGIAGVAALAWCGAKKLAKPGLPGLLASPRSPVWVFIGISSAWFLANLPTSPETGGDLQFQLAGFRQFLNGQTDQFNVQVVPIQGLDLAKDRIEPIIWYPPGPMWLLYPFAKVGLSPDLGARWMIFICFLVGGWGFLELGRKLGFSQQASLALSVVLAFSTLSRDGLAVVFPTSADCIGLAIFPWLSIGTLGLLGGLGEETRIQSKILPFLALGLATGALYVVKYSWFVSGAALAFFLGFCLFLLVRKLPFPRRLVLMGAYSVGFFFPFLSLNQHNRELSGGDALDYNEKGSLGDNAFIEMVYGPNFSSTARPQELPFSIAAGPGFLLGGNLLATRLVHFLRQEHGFTRFFEEKLGTNAHVWALILVCIPFTFLIIGLFALSLPTLEPRKGSFLAVMAFLPILLLGYLSLKSGFNYIVKDNYRYVIPYSLLMQGLLLHVWFRKPQFPNLLLKWCLGIAIFWACVFPSALSLQAQARARSGVPVPELPVLQLESLTNTDSQSITFFLNGHGSRKTGIVPRESHISFILDGALSGNGGDKFTTSKPIRVVVAIEGNLDPSRIDIQSFFARFPGVDWNLAHADGTLYPHLFYTDLRPSSPRC